ncbi:hypothetical protein EVB32_033 [Rhizobium phage RHph_TM39]|nr:hypothetical protein EVB94_033 [Rhizobium phage RHph_TM40]QIG71867.1 hypothetical protein EVB95_033 [Rhizobium phage RHph_TM2_3B]QIG72229.1 hypothetical protein EVB96_033 [Rhizobium phage RHph_TM3_3_6]QIG77021.1 hypothetical protein EVB32_033 [Rhizobium phage RHph_TM39]
MKYDQNLYSKYGYWIKSDGTILYLDSIYGHNDLAKESGDFDPSMSGHDCYSAAIDSGWIRINISAYTAAWGLHWNYAEAKITDEAVKGFKHLIRLHGPHEVDTGVALQIHYKDAIELMQGRMSIDQLNEKIKKKEDEYY